MKLVRALAAAAAAVVAAVAFQLGSPSVSASAGGTDCGLCWPPGIVQR